MRFPQTFIDDLRRQADIVRVIGDYVTLKKKGANWMACCPFHQEKTPSFSVNPSKDIFYCFGCGKGGSVFNFVMEMERLSFPEAVRVVAEKAGMPVPVQEEDKRFDERRKEADEVIRLNAWALEWWEAQLREGAGEARAAREYIDGRGLTEETAKAFRLGFAPNSWDALGGYLKQKGASTAEIERSGLVVKKEAGGFYDRFRGRLIFPVLDAQGRPVAFGGRAIRAEDEPKYLNSPETAAYTKGRHLYGLHHSRDEIRKKKFAILVEGYLDLIVPYQFGIRNVVASLGTALTPEQVKLLGRFARKVVVNYDGDRAGVKAAKRAIEVFLAEDFEVKVLVLPDGSDPDEFIRAHGVEEYNRRRGESFPHIQFVLDQALRDRNLRSPAEKAEAVEEVLPFVRVLRNRIQKREYFDMVLDALRVEEPGLRQELWRSVGGGANAPAIDVKQRVALASVAQPTRAEQRLLELLVLDEELRAVVLPQLEEGDYEALPTAAIYRALKELHESGAPVEFSTLGEMTAEDPVAENLVPLLLMGEAERAEGEATDAVVAEAEGCMLTLRLMRTDRRIKELAAEIAEADRAGDSARRDELIMEDLEWKRYRTALVPRAASAPGGTSSGS
ncbi:MAG TPA: DNA primase [Pyrinomonadaceae bacterium]|jgi:DNA primase|nr:DNA primase [Pyrinomonadaceae bacterium]